MSSERKTLAEIRQIGIEVLIRELGQVGTLRFLNQYESGWGNYSQERHNWLKDENVETLANKIKAFKKK